MINKKEINFFLKKYWKEILVLFLIIIHGFWNDIFLIDTVSVFLLLIAIFLPYIKFIKKIKFGGVEIWIPTKEINKIQEESKDIKVEVEESELRDLLEESLMDLIKKKEFNLAFAKIRIEIESKVNILMDQNFLKDKPQKGLRWSIEELMKAEIISTAVGFLLQDVVSVTNRAIHGEKVKENDVRKVVDSGLVGIHALQHTIEDNSFIKNKKLWQA